MTVDTSLQSWVTIPESSDFTIWNLPFGIFQKSDTGPRLCSAIGDHIIDLNRCLSLGYFDGLGIRSESLLSPTLNEFIGLGKAVTNGVRQRLATILSVGHNAQHKAEEFLIPMSDVDMCMPLDVGDYTDFYSSREHATNVGTMFRGPENALMPNWLHLPVGYHGRASSIVVSGTPIRRPKGQTIPADAKAPVFGASRLVDFELEMGVVVGKANALGTPITMDNAEDHIFGLVLFNDWSARDIQKWEYVPLGPFLGKNFASTISPWVVPLEALDAFRVAGPEQDPTVLPYLAFTGYKNFDIDLEVAIRSASGVEKTVCQSNHKHLYWNMCQQLVHHTVNGCNVRIGDIYASGTISGPSPDSFGSMLELTWRGSRPIEMPDGSTRKFINDGDTVILRGWSERDGVRVGFGEASGTVLPAL